MKMFKELYIPNFLNFKDIYTWSKTITDDCIGVSCSKCLFDVDNILSFHEWFNIQSREEKLKRILNENI